MQPRVHITRQNMLQGAKSPIGVVTPQFIGQQYIDSQGNIYISYALDKSSWASTQARLDNNLKTNSKEVVGAINELNEQCKEKVTKGEIKSSDFQTSNDDDKIKLINLSDEVKQAMAGNTNIDMIIDSKSVTEEKYARKSISVQHIDLFEYGKNLFNKDKITKGYIHYWNGTVNDHNTYYSSDFICVEPNTEYFLNNPFKSHFAFYDKDRDYIDITGTWDNSLPNTFTTPSDAYYFRFTFMFSDKDIIQLEKGDSNTEYEEFQIKLRKDIRISNYAELKIPKILCVAVGRTIEVYNKQICFGGNIDNLHFEYVCAKGKTMKRKWTYSAKDGEEGSYPMTINVYDNNINLIATATTTIKVVNKGKNIVTPKKVLCIGDSLTNSKQWIWEVPELFKSMYGSYVVELVGTMGSGIYKHEGRSGYTSYMYVTDSSYSYQGNYRINVTKVNDIPVSKKRYNITLTNGNTGVFEVETCNIVDGRGTIDLNRISGGGDVPTNGTITGVDSGVVGDNSIDYTGATCISYNPFWNKSSNEVDFDYYKTNSGVDIVDVCQIYLGTNDIIAGYTAIQTRDWIKKLSDKVQETYNCKVQIVLVPYFGNQDGLGNQFGTKALDIKRRKAVFEQHKAIIEQFENDSNVSIVWVGQTHDTEYNFEVAQENVNPRNTRKVDVPIEATHPTEAGYLQMADVIFSNLLNIFQ